MTTQSFNDTLRCPRITRLKTVKQSYLDIPFHFHESCELIYIEEGFGIRLVGDHIEKFTNGDLVLIGPNLPHTWKTDIVFQQRSNYKIKAIVLYFMPEFLKELVAGLPDQEKITRFLEHSLYGISFSGASKKEIINKLQQTSEAEGLRKSILSLEVIELLINSNEFGLLASPKYKKSFAHKNINRFRTIYQYILSNFQNEITLHDVARVANLSSKAFCRYFKNYTGKSLVQFINELRVEHACMLLKNEEYSISSVCFDSGYNSLTHFNNCFKQLVNKTPTEYRKMVLSSTKTGHVYQQKVFTNSGIVQ